MEMGKQEDGFEEDLKDKIEMEYQHTGSRKHEIKLMGGFHLCAQDMMTLFEEREWSELEMFAFLKQLKIHFQVRFFCFRPKVLQDWLSSAKESPQMTEQERSTLTDSSKLLCFFPVMIDSAWVLFRYDPKVEGIKANYFRSFDKQESLRITNKVYSFGERICKFMKTQTCIDLVPFGPKKFPSSTLLLLYFVIKCLCILDSKMKDRNDIQEFVNIFYSDLLPSVILSCKTISDRWQ